jgi:hypothetical protein
LLLVIGAVWPWPTESAEFVSSVGCVEMGGVLMVTLKGALPAVRFPAGSET